MRYLLSLFFAICAFTANASIFDFFSDDKEYIETTKGIEFDESGTCEDIVKTLIETAYFYENNDIVPIEQLVLANSAKAKSNQDRIALMLGVQTGNWAVLKPYLEDLNYTYIAVNKDDITWKVDGKKSNGRVIHATYNDYLVEIETEDDGDYVTLSEDDIKIKIGNAKYNTTKIADDKLISTAAIYNAILQGQI